mgnify:CR=1 FL=1|jgi:hypothetical protein|tara:strand:- start:710 stop:1462 length:753 start_codon:yes stop_codon:yes gene_type:complete
MDSKAAHHKRIVSILLKLNGALLEDTHCVFAGGTAIALQMNDFRLSTDIAFLCSSQEGYRQLRSLVGQYSMTGLSALFEENVAQLRMPRADAYGIRAVLEVKGNPIKFKIVREGNIALDTPTQRLHGIPLITRNDAYATKLLANADRWGDRAVLSRDILDIAAMINGWGAIPTEAEKKAVMAYGDSVLEALMSGANCLLCNASYRQKCFRGLQIDVSIQTELMNILDQLSNGFGLEGLSSPDQGHSGPSM